MDLVRMNWIARRTSRALASTALMSLALLLVVPSKALGYVDPGSGSFIYQAVYAAFLGGIFYARKLLNRLRNKRNK